MTLGATRRQLDLDVLGRQMYACIEELYPLCRSITGDGVRETLRRIRRRLPLTLHEVPTGVPVFDWTVPNEWNIRDAWVKNASGDRVVDFQKSNLHVVSYSVPVRARMALAELKEHPEKFADIAKEKSTDTGSAQKGGDLGTFGQGRMVPEFERVAFALQPGQLSDVVKTQYGYHIIMVSERKEGERKPFDSVKEQIKATLRNKQLQDQMQGHFDALKRDAGLTLDEAALARITPPAGGPPVPAGGH